MFLAPEISKACSRFTYFPALLQENVMDSSCYALVDFSWFRESVEVGRIPSMFTVELV